MLFKKSGYNYIGIGVLGLTKSLCEGPLNLYRFKAPLYLEKKKKERKTNLKASKSTSCVKTYTPVERMRRTRTLLGAQIFRISDLRQQAARRY